MALRQVLKSEYATIFNDIVHPLYGGGRIQIKDEVVLQRSQGKSWDIYESVASDPNVYAVLQKRYNAVVARDWEVRAASDRSQDKKAADMVRAHLTALSARMLTEDQGNAIVSTAGGFDQTCHGLLEAILKGFSIGEILWDSDGKETYPREIRIKNQRRFAFYAGDRGYELRLLTTSMPYDGERLPAKKFICHIFQPHKGPYGDGLGNKLFWPTWFKNSDIKFWLTFCDKYGMPTAIGRYPLGRNDIRDELLNAINAIAQETGIAIPEGAAIDFLTAQHGGVTGAYKDLAEYMDREISKTVLGETGSTDQQAGGGSRARDQVGNEVRIEIAKGDADLLSDTLNRTLCKWITEFNLPDAQPPTVWRKFPELEEDLDARTGRDKALLELGYRLKGDRAIEIYGDEYEPSASTEDSKPALVSTLGVGGTQSLLGFLQQGAGAIPRDNAIAILTTVFGIQRSDAEAMVPEPEQQPPGAQDQLNQIFGGGDAAATEQPAPDQATAEAAPPEQPTDQAATDQPAEQPAPDTTNLAEQKGSQIQTILFPEDWEEDRVREWLKKHNFSSKKVVKEGNLWRSPQAASGSRQLTPTDKKDYRTIDLDKKNGIKAVIAFEEDEEAIGTAQAIAESNAPDSSDFAEKYAHINFNPPQSVRNAFKRGLKLHEKGLTGDGLEPVTVAWARKIANGEPVSPDKARQGNRWFGRNDRFSSAPKDSPAWASYLLWGGAPGKAWFSKLVSQMDAADTADMAEGATGRSGFSCGRGYAKAGAVCNVTLTGTAAKGVLHLQGKRSKGFPAETTPEQEKLIIKQAITSRYRDGVDDVVDYAIAPDSITGRFLDKRWDGDRLFDFTIQGRKLSYQFAPVPAIVPSTLPLYGMNSSVNLAEPPKDVVDDYAERAAEQAQETVNEWVDAIASLIQEIANKDTDDDAKFQELSDRLTELYPDLDVSGFAVPLAEVIATMQLAGRYEVIQEAGES